MYIEQLKFPIGKFNGAKNDFSVESGIEVIDTFPKSIANSTLNLGDEELSWKYRPDGWNIKQLVHHCADSHLNALLRFKLALTEENPTIRPYEEHLWAQLEVGSNNHLAGSLDLITATHFKWVELLNSMKPKDFEKTWFHPIAQKKTDLFQNLAHYAWHCEHHLAHIELAKSSLGVHN